MFHKNLQILVIIIAIILVIGYFWNRKTTTPDLELQSLNNVSDELNTALQPSQSLQNLLE